MLLKFCNGWHDVAKGEIREIPDNVASDLIKREIAVQDSYFNFVEDENFWKIKDQTWNSLIGKNS
jgi:hypothetical protein